MKKLILTILFLSITSLANADINLDQCIINNHNEICTQTIQKIEEQKKEVTIIKEKREELTLNEFITELIAIVKERKQESNLIVNTYIEDNNSSILVINEPIISSNVQCVTDQNGDKICGHGENWTNF